VVVVSSGEAFLEAELRQGPSVELVDDLADISVDVPRAGFAQLVLAEATRLHGDTANASRSSGFDVPDAVSDSQGATGIDGKPLHGREEDFGIRLGAFDVVGGGLPIDSLVGVERLAKGGEFVVRSRSGENDHQALLVCSPEGLGRSGEGENIVTELLVAHRSSLSRSHPIG